VSQSIQKWIEDKLRSGEGLLITSSSIRGGFDVAKKSSGEAAYSEGDDVGREPAEAPTDAQQAALEERAERGDREAMYDLALGMRAQLRLAEAERWWSAAANAGHSRAMRDLAGRLSDRGQYEQAAKWFQAAIAAGDSEAMYRLAEMLHGSRQPREAERWFRAAAEAGDQRAINWLRSQRNTQETFFQAFKNVVLDGNLSAASELARQLVVSGQHKRVEQWLAEDASRENPANARAALEILDRVRQEEDERDHARRANWMS
jgi:tetratricopeptide (TPR) repeat protein